MSDGNHGTGLAPDQAGALAGVLDEIIPPSPDRKLPGAGELGLVRAIEQALERTPDLRPAVEQGLSALGELVGRRGSGGLASLSAAERLEVMNELATREPAFLPGLIFHTYAAYYQDARVVEALGLEPRPPHPKGYPMEAGDPAALLEEVRQRPKRYREC